MNGKVYLFETIGQIADRYVLEAGERLRLNGKRKRGGKKLLRTLLIAAVIASFLGVTAYALGLLGLEKRLIPVGEGEMLVTERDEETGEVTLELRNVQISVGAPNGAPDTAEYQATQEWCSFIHDYEAEMYKNPDTDWKDYEYSFVQTARERSIAEVYPVWDRMELDKLLEIAEKYQLRLLTEMSFVPTEEALCKLAGVPSFCKTPHRLFTMYCFEDGSFHAEGYVELSGERVNISLNRVMTGSLYPFARWWNSDEEIEEWQYTTAEGKTVDIAVETNEYPQLREYAATVFYDRDGAYVELQGSIQADEGETVDYHAAAEALAESMDLDALTACEPTVLETVERDRDAGERSEPGQQYAAFTSSPEFTAGQKFGAFLEPYLDEHYRLDPGETLQIHTDSRWQYALYADDAVAARAKEIGEAHGLVAPESMELLPIQTEEDLEKLGAGQFAELSLFAGDTFVNLYDKGGFSLNKQSGQGFCLFYVPKGTLNPKLYGLAEADQVWGFDTPCGARVTIAKESKGACCVLWETDSAWVVLYTAWGEIAAEALADAIEWTAFR